jgi:low affinity Fe/Cu permease
MSSPFAKSGRMPSARTFRDSVRDAIGKMDGSGSRISSLVKIVLMPPERTMRNRVPGFFVPDVTRSQAYVRSSPVLDRLFTRIATRISEAAGQPLTFILALAFIIVWAVTGPVFQFSDTWQLIVNTSTTIVTFLMVFLIQNSQNRDSASIQAKLDELLRASEGAREQFIGIEHMTESEIEKLRTALEKEAGTTPGKSSSAEKTVAALQKRR